MLCPRRDLNTITHPYQGKLIVLRLFSMTRFIDKLLQSFDQLERKLEQKLSNSNLIII